MTLDYDNSIAMFVYGTLRPRVGTKSWGMDGTELVIHDAYVDGKLFYVSIPGSFPVADLDAQGRIQGDIIIYQPDSAAYHHVCDVETSAGYVLREVEATVIPDNFAEEGEFFYLPVSAWHYTYDTSDKFEVPENNWPRAVKKLGRSYR